MNVYKLKDKKQNIILFLSIVILYFLFENSANAKQIYLPIGGSHIIKNAGRDRYCLCFCC